ncbi:NAD-dependent epimerase/dehydratase family protein [Polynucleobacter necessarius]|uniref:NAD-dependent epimerase/dehydratase family protein n=1 Tax=Polynucleobacter necessarius TaxID=576610 RepID=UPI000E09A5F3|nr:NAD-dependent epimerase/dehydratase family protein [Polynucleobacter necessarius]
MKIFITGVTGYIGGKLLDELLKKKYQVAGLVRTLSADTNLQIHGCKLYQYRNNLDSIKDALQDFRPDVVIHLASLFLANHQSVDIDPLVESNILLSARLYEAMLDAGISKIINTGTSWEHYENASFNPVNLYAATKGAAESILDYYSHAKNFTTFNFKLFDSYGPGDFRKKLFFYLREAARSGVTLKMSPGEQLINLVYIDDIISAYMQAISSIHNYTGKHTFGVGADKLISLKNLVAIYSDVIQRDVPVHFGALPYRDREVMAPWNDYLKIPNWSPKISILNGISKMELDESIGGLLSGK